ncbi:carbon-nitrogen hydrolase family protein [Komagataeibacter sp. FNDCF1]|uniref:carbon-nitrogen hydrolase family protein n=1 Tax=Komagataeibacter sp. FNDCF1 TaxID=2878681 RepID=UPI001E2BD904|nr:carbon-nitrogen hydrolase family protein [Komagataeibacter sp. FNDCF1]MCE2565150.1 carbon-nitrogen hydrolase family protein [Komagataeibacter sp. FNDCF1]
MSVSLRLGTHSWQVEQCNTLDDYAAHLDRVTAEGARKADLLVLPEYSCMEVAAAFATAQSDAMSELHAVCEHASEILHIMCSAARRHDVWLMPGTLPWADSTGRIRNRAPLIAPDGRHAFQDKHVMTRFETESWDVKSGNPPGFFETPWGRIGTSICYDSEFPALARSQIEAGVWLLLVPTCTDTMHGFNRVRISARARALENQCFVAVSPTVGAAPWLATLDENRGTAGIYGPMDRGFPDDGIIAEGGKDVADWAFATLSPDALEQVRTNGAVKNCHDWPQSVPEATALSFS